MNQAVFFRNLKGKQLKNHIHKAVVGHENCTHSRFVLVVYSIKLVVVQTTYEAVVSSPSNDCVGLQIILFVLKKVG